MLSSETLLVFIPIALALNLTPGADMLFCLGQGVKSGPKAGIAASLGIATGSFLQALAGGLGLAALIQTTPFAFEVIRWSGVAYLLYLAAQTLRGPSMIFVPMEVSRSAALTAWRGGVLVCLLNPKVAIFMLALVPQFVDPAQGSVAIQFLLLGTILNVGGTAINALVGVFAGRIGRILAEKNQVAKVLQYASSMVFFSLAAKLAVERR